MFFLFCFHTSAAKIITKKHFSKRIVLAQLISKNYKALSLESKFLRMFKENALVELFL